MSERERERGKDLRARGKVVPPRHGQPPVPGDERHGGALRRVRRAGPVRRALVPDGGVRRRRGRGAVDGDAEVEGGGAGVDDGAAGGVRGGARGDGGRAGDGVEVDEGGLLRAEAEEAGDGLGVDRLGAGGRVERIERGVAGCPLLLVAGVLPLAPCLLI